MKALVKSHPVPEEVEWTDWPEPVCGDNDILIKVEAAGICGTDMSVFDWAERTVQEHNVRLPIVMGHEFSGLVTQVGKNVKKDINVGDLVTANIILYCGICRFCREGQTNVCDNRPTLGIQVPGVFAEMVAVRAENVYKVENGVPPSVAALSEPLCVAIHATERVMPKPGDVVAVVGSGSIGLLMVLVLKEMGVETIFLTGIAGDENRLALGRELGAVTINVSEQEPLEMILASTGGHGCDIAFETAGHPKAVLQALSLVRKQGKVGLIGMPHDLTSISTTALCIRENEMIGIRAYTPATWQKCVKLLPKLEKQLSRLITHSLPMSEAKQGFALMKKREAIKVILVPK
ncbi:MAG: L-iditol 2-dehydrogenase [Clostridia bacterium]|nr:L-iditol 2-dehydrogenase [Clostridia bacterium]